MRKQKIVFIVLIVISCLVWSRNLKLQTASKRPAAAGNKNAVSLEGFAKMPERSSYSAWVRDPFTVDKKIDTSSSDIQLKGIMFDPSDCYALINDQVAHIGDVVQGARIINITKDTVILNDGGEDFELKLSD